MMTRGLPHKKTRQLRLLQMKQIFVLLMFDVLCMHFTVQRNPLSALFVVKICRHLQYADIQFNWLQFENAVPNEP